MIAACTPAWHNGTKVLSRRCRLTLTCTSLRWAGHVDCFSVQQCKGMGSLLKVDM